MNISKLVHGVTIEAFRNIHGMQRLFPLMEDFRYLS